MSEFKGLERSCNKDVFTLKQKNMLEQVSNDYPSLLNHFRRAYRELESPQYRQNVLNVVGVIRKQFEHVLLKGAPMEEQTFTKGSEHNHLLMEGNNSTSFIYEDYIVIWEERAERALLPYTYINYSRGIVD